MPMWTVSLQPVWVPFWGNVGLHPSALPHHIPNVVFSGPHAQVLWVYARRVVAGMHHYLCATQLPVH